MDGIFSLSPLDGRYAESTKIIKNIFSEYSLIQKRIFVEIKWLQWILKIDCLSFSKNVQLSNEELEFLESITKVTPDMAKEVKAIENEIGHDMKAIEYFIRRIIENAVKTGKIQPSILSCLEAVHFCCTSEDINNIVYSLMLSQAVNKSLRCNVVAVIKQLGLFASEYQNSPMLGLTHGQPATPTTFGKEIGLFATRLMDQLSLLDKVQYKAKFNGAVGNMNAHVATNPNISWETQTKEFISSLGLDYQQYSTQIEQHDYIAELCHVMMRIHTILIDMVQDLWLYISRGILKLKVNTYEIGSSTMPHKVNPIDFENAEGNLGLANALLSFFASKLPVSRMQRDLSDSTVLRNIGVAFGYSSVAFQSILKGLKKLQLNIQMTKNELTQHWEILGEPIQTILRSNGIPNGYEVLKSNTRGVLHMNKQSYDKLLEQILPLVKSSEVKTQILALTPESYTGIAPLLASRIAHAAFNIK